jgi:nucleotide-binding universal stress UspA family protein
MAHVSHKLKSSFEGALAGGGDPATSPLYVFGPFLRLIVVAGVSQITFGASVWMVVLTIAVVSAMYRLVMRWVTDGSGGSGLSEEEFGSWAVKINAAITFIEYTLTFLVSMAAMVTFIADRFPALNEAVLGIQYRTFVAIILSVVTGWLVNRGPTVAARAFGPATAGVLLLLWVMIFTTIAKFGLILPEFNLDAFSGENLRYTIGGYVRILAVMTGIEVFANLVAAYDGSPAEKSSKAFRSLLIIMGTTAATMLIVGPTIFSLADPLNEHVSVFTQTMDALLPAPLPLVGTVVGIAVLMSASAAAAQGVQNLALGLKHRRYIPEAFGRQNQYEVADRPVWLQVGLVVVTYLFFGTNEETYLAIYAAGVFILLSMTGWAVTKRLIREIRQVFSIGKLALIGGTILAATLTTVATIIIFEERFLEGAWTFLIFIPMLYAAFSYFRSRLGDPDPTTDYIGQLDAAQVAGFGFGQTPDSEIEPGTIADVPLKWEPAPIEQSNWRKEDRKFAKIAVLLDGSDYAAQALPLAKWLAKRSGATLFLLSSVKNDTRDHRDKYAETEQVRTLYLERVAKDLASKKFDVKIAVRPGYIAESTQSLVDDENIDLVIISDRGKSASRNWETGGASVKLMGTIQIPVVIVPTVEQGEKQPAPKLKRIMLGLDGSIRSEKALPYARELARIAKAELVLLTVPAVPETEKYRAAAEVVEKVREKAVSQMEVFLAAVSDSLRKDGIKVKTSVTGIHPARTIVREANEQNADLVMLTSRGRGGMDLFFTGSVAERVVDQINVPVLMVPSASKKNGKGPLKKADVKKKPA